jgi:hypothetical protein
MKMVNQDQMFAGFITFETRMKEAMEEDRRSKQEKLAEERRQAKLRTKLLLLQACLASQWAVTQMAKPVGCHPQL